MKKGLDPEALTGKYPPKIRMYSKYERRTDTRTYGRRSTMNGSSAPRQSCLSGSERDPAKRLATPSPLKMRRMLESRLHLLTTMLKKKKKRKRKKRRKKKTNK